MGLDHGDEDAGSLGHYRKGRLHEAVRPELSRRRREVGHRLTRLIGRGKRAGRNVR